MFFLLCFSWIRQGLFLVLRDFQGLTQVIIPQDEVSATKTRVCVFIFPLVLGFSSLREHEGLCHTECSDLQGD